MKKIGYFWVLNTVIYKIPVYNYTGSRNRAQKACEEKNDKLATTCEEIRSSGYVPEKIAVCTSGIYISGKNNDGRTKTVRV